MIVKDRKVRQELTVWSLMHYQVESEEGSMTVDIKTTRLFYRHSYSCQAILSPGHNIHHGCHQVTGLSNIMNTAICQRLVKCEHNAHNTSYSQCWLSVFPVT